MQNPFIQADGLSLVDVKEQIEVDSALSSSRKASVRSAISCLGKALGKDLAAIPANVEFIRIRLSRMTAAQAGVTAKRFSTIKSEVKWAFKHVGLIEGGHYLHPITGRWQRLWDALPSKYARTTFSRLFRYCSKHDISPNEMSDAVLDEFRKAVEAEAFIKNPRVLHQNNARVWNQMLGVVEGWPGITLTVPRYADHYILEWSAFPNELKLDCERFIARQQSDDLLDFDAPPQPLRPRTLKQYQYDLRRAASILVHVGHDPGSLQSLADLTRPERVAEIARFILARKDRKKSFSASDLAILLAKVAKHYIKAPPEDVQKIKRIGTRTRPTPGLSQKNRDRLAPLRDPMNLAKLFLLPGKILKTIEAKASPSRADALLMQHAVAISILTYAPIRIGNLAALDCNAHLRWSQPGLRGDLIIDIAGDDVKNGQSLSFPVPQSCSSLIRLYLRKYRPVLADAGNPYLFPGPKPDSPKRSDTLGKQLTRLVHKTVGLHVNPHLYRHLVHLIVLHRFPGAYAMVSRILGHRSLQTAISNYAAEDINISMRAFQDLIKDIQIGRGNRFAGAALVADSFQEVQY